MDHEPALIATIAIGLTAAFAGGLIARRPVLPAILRGAWLDRAAMAPPEPAGP